MANTSIRIPDALRAQYDELAIATGRTRNYLMTEALERYAAEERWQLARVEEGLRDADAENVIPHEQVGADWLARGLMTQEGLDRAARELTLDELQRAQQ